MIKVSVMYPWAEGARFDHDYYRDRHLPMVKDRLGEACVYYSIEKGLGGAGRGVPPSYVASCQIVCRSLESFEQAMAAQAGPIMADIPNYTDIQPVIQVSELVVDRS